MSTKESLLMSAQADAGKRYLEEFVGAGDPTSMPSWMQGLRASGAAQFSAMGLPTRRDEEFRFTPVARLADTPFRPADAKESTLRDIQPFDFPELTGNRLVFVNGIYSPEHTRLAALPDGAVVCSIQEALQRDESLVQRHLGQYARLEAAPFVALNTAALADGAFIYLPRNASVDEPIHLLFISVGGAQPTVSHPRVLIVAEECSSATIIETYASPPGDVRFCNAVTEIVCGENSHIDHYKTQRESLEAVHIATMQTALNAHATFSSHSIVLGGGLVRNDANAHLGGEGIECTLNGVYLGDGKRIIDNHTAIDHAMPHCNSHEIYKGILSGEARGVFNGKIFVRPDAQKTDAKQTNQTLLLSPTAQINTKPQLEIFADDVRCTHGATVGQLSSEALFYLRSRGIGADQARALLIYAFAGEIVDRIQVGAVREQLRRALLENQALDELDR